MRLIGYRALLTLGLFMVLGHETASAQLAQDAAIADNLLALTRSQDAAQPQTGLIVAVGFPDGSVWEGASGWSDPVTATPILPDHRLVFASITKTFVAAVVMLLVEDGVLSLDDRVGKWVGPFTHVNAGITIRQLLGHTSGVYNYTNHPNLQSRIRSDASRNWSPQAVLTEFVNPPVFFAGFGASYSNTNYVILETIVESATGNSLGTEIRHRLLDPNGLLTAYFGPEESSTGDIPTTWVDLNGNGTLDDFSDWYDSASYRTIRGAAGGMLASTGDIARWAKALFQDGVLSANSLEAMLDFHLLAGTNATWTGYGLGVQQFQIAGLEMWGHSGLVTGSTSLMLYSPELGLSLAMIDNDARSNHFGTALAFMTYLGSLDLTASPTRTEEVLPMAAEISVYPNPVAAGASVTLQLETPGRQDVRFYDLLGRHVLSFDVNSGSQLLDVGSLTRGTYLYRAEDGSRGQLLVR